MTTPADQPLAGRRIGVTATRKVDEQTALLVRRGAEVVWAPALSTDPYRMDPDALRDSTAEVLSRPVDLFLATTGMGMRAWFAAAQADGTDERLRSALAGAEILARGPKSVGALRQLGLRERWSPASEEFADVLAHLDDRDLHGLRIVVQEHGWSLSPDADRLRARGADVVSVAVYRIAGAEDEGPTRALLDEVVAGTVDAVTFTAAPAIGAVMALADREGRVDEVRRAFSGPVVASCVGPVTAAAFDVWEVPSVYPDRSRLGAMVKQLEHTLSTSR